MASVQPNQHGQDRDINHCQPVKGVTRHIQNQHTLRRNPGSVGRGSTPDVLALPCHFKQPCTDYLDTRVLVPAHLEIAYTCLGACGYESVRDLNQFWCKKHSYFLPMRFRIERSCYYSVGTSFPSGQSGNSYVL